MHPMCGRRCQGRRVSKGIYGSPVSEEEAPKIIIERFTEPCVLLLLKEGPLHGYALMEKLTERHLIHVPIDIGNLYRFMRQLEREGLVTSKWSVERPGPNKRVYRITPSGEKSLHHWAGELEKTRAIIDNFLRSSYLAQL